MLLLCGSLRERLFSWFLTLEAAKVLEAFGAEVRVFDPALRRAFRDAAGRLNRRVALQADHAVVMFCGLGVTLKGAPQGFRERGL